MHRRHRLLILSCSARKHRVTGEVTAWDLYDGVAFRVVKQLQREGQFPDDVHVLILSAQYGLIPPHRKISFYDLRMTQELAVRQATRNCMRLRTARHRGSYREVFVNAGQTYLAGLQPIAAWLLDGVTFRVASGGIGQKLHEMKWWLLSSDMASTSGDHLVYNCILG